MGPGYGRDLFCSKILGVFPKFFSISFESIKLIPTFASPFKNGTINYVTANQDKIAVIRPQPR